MYSGNNDILLNVSIAKNITTANKSGDLTATTDRGSATNFNTDQNLQVRHTSTQTNMFTLCPASSVAPRLSYPSARSVQVNLPCYWCPWTIVDNDTPQGDSPLGHLADVYCRCKDIIFVDVRK